MKETAEYIRLLRLYFEETAKHKGVVRMALFGSVARHEHSEDSDVDVAYEGAPNLLLRIRMKMDLERLFGCKVDLVRLRDEITDSSFGKELDNDLIYV